MNKAYYALIPILFVASFFAYSNRTFLIDTVKPVTNVLGSSFAKVQVAWNGLPIWVKGLIPLSIPIATTVFFAWAKNLWQKKAQQTEIRAAQQQNQMQGEITEVRTVNTNLRGTIENLSSQPANTSTLELREALLNVQTKDQRIKSLEEQIHDLQALVSDLKLDNKALEIRLKEKTTYA